MKQKKIREGDRLIKGFTLIEVIVAMAIFAILATIAVSSYRAQIDKSNRSEAMRAATNAAGQAQRCLAENITAVNTPGNLCPFALQSQRGYYNIVVASPRPATPGNNASFLVTVTPAPGQPPTADQLCTSFTLDETGLRGVTWTTALPPPAGQTQANYQANYCWGTV